MVKEVFENWLADHPHGCFCMSCAERKALERRDDVIAAGAQVAALPPFALTEGNIGALETAIRGEGFDITADPETGEVKLVQTPALDNGAVIERVRE